MEGTKLIHQNTRNQSAICHVFVYNYFVIQIKMHILQISVVYFTDRKKVNYNKHPCLVKNDLFLILGMHK
jgi:hypothetical protein